MNRMQLLMTWDTEGATCIGPSTTDLTKLRTPHFPTGSHPAMRSPSVGYGQLARPLNGNYKSDQLTKRKRLDLGRYGKYCIDPWWEMDIYHFKLAWRKVQPRIRKLSIYFKSRKKRLGKRKVTSVYIINADGGCSSVGSMVHPDVYYMYS